MYNKIIRIVEVVLAIALGVLLYRTEPVKVDMSRYLKASEHASQNEKLAAGPYLIPVKTGNSPTVPDVLGDALLNANRSLVKTRYLSDYALTLADNKPGCDAYVDLTLTAATAPRFSLNERNAQSVQIQQSIELGAQAGCFLPVKQAMGSDVPLHSPWSFRRVRIGSASTCNVYRTQGDKITEKGDDGLAEQRALAHLMVEAVSTGCFN